MAKFRKKPVEVEAEQFFGNTESPFGGEGIYWERDSRDDGEFLRPYVITIHEQKAYLADGDWVIREPNRTDRYYPCKRGIFAATYEPAEDATATT
jgi:hypothetical protein